MNKKMINFSLLIAVIIIYAAISNLQWGLFSGEPDNKVHSVNPKKATFTYRFSTGLQLKRNVFRPLTNERNKVRKHAAIPPGEIQQGNLDTLAILKSKYSTTYLLKKGDKICIR